MANDPQRAAPEDGPVAVADKAKRRRFRWEIVGPLIAALRFCWEIVRSLKLDE